MERESTTQGPRADDALARRTEGLVRGAPVEPRSAEDRRGEDPGDDALIDAGSRPEVEGRATLDERQLAERAELARLLTGLAYPTGREEIVDQAAKNGADETTLGRLGRLPEGEFDLLEAVWEALGGQPD